MDIVLINTVFKSDTGRQNVCRSRSGIFSILYIYIYIFGGKQILKTVEMHAKGETHFSSGKHVVFRTIYGTNVPNFNM